MLGFVSVKGETVLHYVASSGNCLFLAEKSPDKLISGDTPAIFLAADNGLKPLFDQLYQFVKRGYRSLTEKRNLQTIKNFIITHETDLAKRINPYKECRKVFEELTKLCKIKDEY